MLKNVDFILAEDTRTSGILLKHLEISKPLQAFHQHNEHKVLDRVMERLKSGEKAALISDAGIPALVCSGLPCDRFSFEGFLPHKKGRQTRLQELADETRTMVFYESPHRLLKTLKQFLLVQKSL